MFTDAAVFVVNKPPCITLSCIIISLYRGTVCITFVLIYYDNGNAWIYGFERFVREINCLILQNLKVLSKLKQTLTEQFACYWIVVKCVIEICTSLLIISSLQTIRTTFNIISYNILNLILYQRFSKIKEAMFL